MSSHFQIVAKAIHYIQQHVSQQPNLETIAQHVGLSPFHFQRVFSEWAGTSPKQFLHFLTLQHAKQKLQQQSIMNVSLDLGLSSPARLHDLFIKLQGMTPGDYKQGGHDLIIQYCFTDSVFGHFLLACTDKGICYLAFHASLDEGMAVLKQHFPQARYVNNPLSLLVEQICCFFTQDQPSLPSLKLHLKGTAFQLKVWEMLLTIPYGHLSTYQTIARQIDKPNASRAVGTAIGANPVSFLIPCHRVIQSSGALGGYRWGLPRKTAMLAWEAIHSTPKP